MIKFEFKNPFIGERLNVTETPDEVFSQKLLGPGFVYMPTVGKVFSPIDGYVSMIFPTGHAIAVKHAEGFEVLIHIGLDSVELKGACFKHLTKVNQPVKMGELLVEFDLDLLSKKAQIASPVVFVQMQKLEFIKSLEHSIEKYQLL